MTVHAFQRALADLVASPALCLSLRDDPAGVLGRYDLSERERRRLVDVVWQRGMSTNCSLYRSNRITPLYTLLPLTSFVLGERFAAEVDAFWARPGPSDVQYQPEIHRFASFLRLRLRGGEIEDPILEEVADYEVALTELQFSPRRRILEDLQRGDGGGAANPRLRLHPLVRVVRFRHEPQPLLARLSRREPLPYRLDEGRFALLLTIARGELEMGVLGEATGERLLALQAGRECESRAGDAPLLDAGLAVLHSPECDPLVRVHPWSS